MGQEAYQENGSHQGNFLLILLDAFQVYKVHKDQLENKPADSDKFDFIC